MPVSYRVLPEQGVVVVELRGRIDDAELLEATDRLIADADRLPGLNELVDARELEVNDLSSAALRKVADRFAAGPRPDEGVRVALVAGSDVAYGLGRMYQALRDGSAAEFRVFRELPEARGWLGLGREG
jgi:hypothetical protein